jgi:hypothetical protein
MENSNGRRPQRPSRHASRQTHGLNIGPIAAELYVAARAVFASLLSVTKRPPRN